MAMKKALNFSTFHAEKWEKKQGTQEESQGEWQNFKYVVKPMLPVPTGYGQSVEVYHAYAQGQNPSVKVGAYGANGDVFYVVCCVVCNTSAELSITHPVTHIDDYCKVHVHVHVKLEQTLEEKVSIASNGNVKTKHNKNSYPSIDEYYLTCTYCKQQSSWLEASNLEQCALGFAKAHRHTVPTAPTMTMFTYKPNPIIVSAAYYEEAKEFSNDGGGWVDGILQFHGVSQKEPTMTQALLKSIAKLSNFNVNLQAKKLVTGTYDYRAVCDKCGSSQHFNYRSLVEKNGDAWVELGKFLDAHRHTEVLSVTMTVGRKFRVE